MIETVIRDRRSSLVGEKNMSHFPFRGSPNIQNTVSSAPSSPPVSVAMAVTSTVPPGARSSSPCSGASGPQNTRCCDTGRPIFTDQATGQTICSCQYDLINYRLANAGITPSGIPLSMYSMPYAESIPGYFPGVGGDQPPFYPNPGPGLDLKENLAAGGVHWPYPHVYAAYDATFGGYPFNGYGLDVNGARRKNATRETTSTLKAWLNEHKKNPYPTKGEKIMLAIITKMTLTQVSTWFANARRRLKKENKMTWEPRNRVDDDDANVDDDDHKSTDGKDLIIDSKDSCTGSSEDGDRSSNRLDMLDQPSGMDMKSDWSESRPNSGPNSPDICDRTRSLHHPLIHPSALHHLRPLTGSPQDPKHTPGVSTINSNVINKPRIWSVADMACKENTSDSQPSQSGIYSPAPGKIISPLSGRYPIHPSPYVKPEFYRSFYSPSPAHLPGGHTDVSLLESYQLTFGASLAHNRLAAMNPLTSMKTKPPGNLPHPLTPLNLPLNSTTPPSGISPSASSTSSGPEITSVPSVDKSSPPINVTRP